MMKWVAKVKYNPLRLACIDAGGGDSFGVGSVGVGVGNDDDVGGTTMVKVEYRPLRLTHPLTLMLVVVVVLAIQLLEYQIWVEGGLIW